MTWMNETELVRFAQTFAPDALELTARFADVEECSDPIAAAANLVEWAEEGSLGSAAELLNRWDTGGWQLVPSEDISYTEADDTVQWQGELYSAIYLKNLKGVALIGGEW